MIDIRLLLDFAAAGAESGPAARRHRPGTGQSIGRREFVAGMLRRIPTGRVGTPDDIAPLALFLSA
jgi:NAD(P)-dependent dehydrogenase (short-subunit alcohol dehydrogenase family)